MYEYIRILLGDRPILNISRLKVKCVTVRLETKMSGVELRIKIKFVLEQATKAPRGVEV
jgi:hypothetical protein